MLTRTMNTCRACREEVEDEDSTLCNNCWEVDSRIDGLNLKATIYFLNRLFGHLISEFLDI